MQKQFLDVARIRNASNVRSSLWHRPFRPHHSSLSFHNPKTIVMCHIIQEPIFTKIRQRLLSLHNLKSSLRAESVGSGIAANPSCREICISRESGKMRRRSKGMLKSLVVLSLQAWSSPTMEKDDKLRDFTSSSSGTISFWHCMIVLILAHLILSLKFLFKIEVVKFE